MRYAGQNYDVEIHVPNGEVREETLGLIAKNFSDEYRLLYGHSKDAELEFVNLRVSIIGVISKPKLRMSELKKIAPKKGTERREVYFGGRHGSIQTEVIQRKNLVVEKKIEGPYVIEDVDSTTIVYPGQSARSDEFGNIIIKTVS